MSNIGNETAHSAILTTIQRLRDHAARLRDEAAEDERLANQYAEILEAYERTASRS